MRMISSAIALAAALVAVDAMAQTQVAQTQVLNLTGRYRCVAMCLSDQPGLFAYITQNGLEINIVNEVGSPSRAWIDYPGHLWIDRAQQGAIYSSDGITIQFDRGTVWRRDLGEAEPAPRERGRRVVEPRRVVVAPPVAGAPFTNAFDGNWNVILVTQSGPCDPEYRFATQINNGSVVYSQNGINLQGTVASNGNIAVSVAAGSQFAQGEGVLSPLNGSGTWRGQGSIGSCVGTWYATRRT